MQQKIWWLLAFSFIGTLGAMDRTSTNLVKSGIELLRARRVPLSRLQWAEENARVIRARLVAAQRRRAGSLRLGTFDFALYLQRGGRRARL